MAYPRNVLVLPSLDELRQWLSELKQKRDKYADLIEKLKDKRLVELKKSKWAKKQWSGVHLRMQEDIIT